MWISYAPLDTLFFRDGRPFSMGEETWAEGIFPPPPSVFLGAIRSALLSLQPELFTNMSDNDPTTDISIENIHFAYDQADYLRFICPGDIVRKKKEQESHLLTLKKNAKTNSYLLDYLPTSSFNGEVESFPPHFFLDHASFEDYLNGEFLGRPEEMPVYFEPKIGIGRTKVNNTVIEGKLYRVGLQRYMHDNGNKLFFNIHYNLPTPLASLIKDNRLAFAKAGAENKAVEATILSSYPKVTLPKFTRKDCIFKILLISPAIFKNAWIPDFIDPHSFKGTFHGIQVKFISAITGKPMAIGGFDMLRKEPKPMAKAVPAGSVYFFQLTDDNQSLETFANNLTGPIRISHWREKEGFGLAYLGKVTSQLNLAV